VDELINEVGDGDHGQREGAEKVVAAGREKPRESVPDEQYPDVGESDDAEEDREGAVGAVEATVHRLIMDCGAKGSCKGGGGIIASNFSTVRFSMRFRNSEAISLVLCALLLRCIVGMAQRPCRSTVFVTVLDPNTNQPIDGLTASDFHPKFRGRELPIRALGSSPSGRRIVFVLDRSGSMTHASDEAPFGHYDPNSLEKLALGDALSNVPTSDSVAFLSFAGQSSSHTGFMQPAVALERMPETLKWNTEGKENRSRTALWDNLDAALRMLLPYKSGDLIVVISDGGDNLSKLPEGTVRDELLYANVPIVAMIVPPPLSAPHPLFDGLLTLLDLVKATGGGARIAGSPTGGIDPEVVLPVRPGQLIRLLAHQYELEVDAPSVGKPERWQIGVGPLESGKKVRLLYRRNLLPCASLR